MKKIKVFGIKEYSKDEAPHKDTLPNGKIVKTYFVPAKDLDDALEKLAEHLGRTVEVVRENYGLYYINLSFEQLAQIPPRRREFIK